MAVCAAHGFLFGTLYAPVQAVLYGLYIIAPSIANITVSRVVSFILILSAGNKRPLRQWGWNPRMLGAIMYASKLLMEFAPNIHLLGVFTIAFTVVYRKKKGPIDAVFVIIGSHAIDGLDIKPILPLLSGKRSFKHGKKMQ